jgi:hypothetical protein
MNEEGFVLTVRGHDGDLCGLKGVVVHVGGGEGRLVRHHPSPILRLKLQPQAQRP